MNKHILTDTPDDRGEIVVYQPDEVTSCRAPGVRLWGLSFTVERETAQTTD